MLSTILIIIVILLLIGALPTWPYSSGWGYYPGGWGESESSLSYVLGRSADEFHPLVLSQNFDAEFLGVGQF